MTHHETIGDNPRIVRLGSFSEKLQVPFPRALDVHVEPPVMESRDDVKQPACHVESGVPRHGQYVPGDRQKVNLLCFLLRP